jgi:2-polyprenyl-3-methyl-5-hydroxy-6-metoxy-1,4-benzoquinol methylase
MTKTITDRFFSFAQQIFYKGISPKFRTGSLKTFMDSMYIFFEKFALHFDILSSYYLRLYDELVEKEVNMAKVTSDDLILVIGCGSLPATSLLIAMKTKAKIVSIDIDNEAIHNASWFIKHLNFEDRMKTENVDGLHYPVQRFDVIFVLYGVKQQKEILKYLSHNMKKNARVIYRTTDDVQKEILGGSLYLSTLFHVENRVRSEKLYSMESYLLLKKSQK